MRPSLTKKKHEPVQSGDVTGLWGDVTGLRGDATGIIGSIDKCTLSKDERKAGIDIHCLVASIPQSNAGTI